MIAKVCNRGGTTSPGFEGIAAYVGHDAKAIAIAIAPSVASVRTCAHEMDLIAQLSRSRAGNPVYHYVLSWPGSDHLSTEEIFASARGSLGRLGFLDHQWVAAIHGDSEFQHVHIVVNRIHPRTLRAHSPHLDHRALSQYCREEELRHGWTPGAGLYEIHDGAVVADAGRRARTPAIDQRAVDGESWTGVLSFQRWVGDAPAIAARRVLASDEPSWAGLHEALAPFDVEYRPFGRGATIVARTDTSLRAKAGHLDADFGFARLSEILGPYRPPDPGLAAERRKTYAWQRATGQLRLAVTYDPQIAPLYLAYQAEVRAWHSTGRTRRNAAWRDVRVRCAQRLSALRVARNVARHGLQEQAIRAVAPSGQTVPIDTTTMWDALAHVFDERLAQARDENRADRAAVSVAHRAPPALFRSWLKARALAGDADAALARTLLRSGRTTPRHTLAPIIKTEEHSLVEQTPSPNGGTIRPSDAKLAQSVDVQPSVVNRIMQPQASSAEVGAAYQRDVPQDIEYANYLDTLARNGMATPYSLWQTQIEREAARRSEVAALAVKRRKDILSVQGLSGAERSNLLAKLTCDTLQLQQQEEAGYQLQRLTLHEVILHGRAPTFNEYAPDLDDIPSAPYRPRAADIPLLTPSGVDVTQLSYAVDENGAVAYHYGPFREGTAFIERAKSLDMDHEDRGCIRAALLVAQLKWGSTITIDGTKSYCAAVAEEAAALGIQITNPELQQIYNKARATCREDEKQKHARFDTLLEAEAKAPCLDYADSTYARRVPSVIHDAVRAAAAQAVGAMPDFLDEAQANATVRGPILASWIYDDQGYVVINGANGAPYLGHVHADAITYLHDNDLPAVTLQRSGDVCLVLEHERARTASHQRDQAERDASFTHLVNQAERRVGRDAQTRE